MKQYVLLHSQIFRLIDYYAGETIALLEGDDMSIDWEVKDDNSRVLSKPSGKSNCS